MKNKELLKIQTKVFEFINVTLYFFSMPGAIFHWLFNQLTYKETLESDREFNLFMTLIIFNVAVIILLFILI